MTNPLQILQSKVNTANLLMTHGADESGEEGEEEHTHHVCIRHWPKTRHIDVCPHFCHALWGKGQQGPENITGKPVYERLCIFVKLMVCVHDGEVCLLAFNQAASQKFNCNQGLESNTSKTRFIQAQWRSCAPVGRLNTWIPTVFVHNFGETVLTLLCHRLQVLEHNAGPIVSV